MGLPTVNNDVQGTFLQRVYLLLSEKRRWPTFRELADDLYRKGGFAQSEFEVWAGMPGGLVRPPAPASETGGETTPVGLTVAGAKWVLDKYGRTGAADRFEKAFLTCIERALFLDRNSPGKPLTNRDGIQPLGSGGGHVDELRLLGFVLAGEPLGFKTIGLAGDAAAEWTFTLGPGIRKFRGVVQGTIGDLESYWTARTEVEPTAVRSAPVAASDGATAGSETAARGEVAHGAILDGPAARVLDGHAAKGTDERIMARPSVFLGSSTAGRPIAAHLKAALEQNHECDATVWDEGVFEVGGYTLGSLERVAKTTDFAVLVATPDDTLTLPDGATSSTVRDNVVFELGLFIGALGSDRVYIVADRSKVTLRLPTDLAGVTWAPYRERADGNVASAVGIAATLIGAQIRQLGRRATTQHVGPASQTSPRSLQL